MASQVARSSLFTCPFVGLPPSSYSTVRMSWEMNVYEVTGASPVPRATESGDTVYMFDVSETPPIVRRDYDITVETALGRMSAERELEFRREAATEMARRLVALSWEDLRRGVRSAAPRQSEPPPVPPSENVEDPQPVEPVQPPLPPET